MHCAKGVYWIALQMAQQDIDWLKGELQRLKQEIKVKEQELREATEAKELPELIALIKQARERRVDQQKVLLNILQAASLASPSGEDLAAARC